MKVFSGKAALAAAVILLSSATGPEAAPVEKAGGGLFYFYGRGVLHVPPGWTLTKQVDDNLVFEKTTTSPYPDNCLVSGGVAHEGDRKQSDSMAAFLIQDYTDDFSKKSANWPDRTMRNWAEPYRDMTAARFFGSARAKNAFAFRSGRKIDGYVSTSVMEIAKAGVAMAVRCNGLYKNIHERVGADMMDAVDIDASRPRVLH